MSRFGFAHCPDCGRLNIHGAKCVCVKRDPLECDCDGGPNYGPNCARREREQFASAVRQSREHARKIAKGEA